MRVKKPAVIYLTILTLAVFGFASPVFSQGSTLSKSADSYPTAGEEINPGDEVRITIRVPGGTAVLRNPADVMLVMDRTGSMAETWCKKKNKQGWCIEWERKIDSAKNALIAFVEKTTEDKGATSPGDYVGLVTYAAPPPFGLSKPCPSTGTCASLDFPIANMTDANKIAIKDDCGPSGCGINYFSANGYTSIGSGMDIANKELLNQYDIPNGPASTSRKDSGVRPYMVLATDGEQNTYPSPDDLGILQTAVDNKIMVFTVAIGSGAGFDLLRQIACKTDWFDPDDPCNMTRKDGNPDTNDIESPRNFFVANNASALTLIYEEIQNRISQDFWYMVTDFINTTSWGGANAPFAGGSLDAGDFGPNTVYNCDEYLNWPTIDPAERYEYEVAYLDSASDYFQLLIKDIPEGETACISIVMTVRNDPAFLTWLGAEQNVNIDVGWIPFNMVTAWPPGETCDTNGDGKVDVGEGLACQDRTLDLPSTPIGNRKFWIKNPAKPWLQTRGGDVGVQGSISMQADPTKQPVLSNADYLVIAENAIDKFISAKSWLVQNYPTSTSPSLDLPPFTPLPTSMHDALLARYSKRCHANLGGATPNDIINTVSTSGCNILEFSGTYTIGGDWKAPSLPGGVYTGPPAIIFVSNQMEVNEDLNIGPNTGLIFVVKSPISVNKNTVDRMDGIFITDSNFESVRNLCAGFPETTSQLLINGAVYAFGQACFYRGLTDNRVAPAELINFEPKYLWLFRDIIGNSKVVYREVAP